MAAWWLIWSTRLFQRTGYSAWRMGDWSSPFLTLLDHCISLGTFMCILNCFFTFDSCPVFYINFYIFFFKSVYMFIHWYNWVFKLWLHPIYVQVALGYFSEYKIFQTNRTSKLLALLIIHEWPFYNQQYTLAHYKQTTKSTVCVSDDYATVSNTAAVQFWSK